MPMNCLTRAASIGLLAVAVSACGNDDRPSTQVAAKVNKGEVTIHQVNHVLQRMPGLSAERIPQAKIEVVERLIDQEVLVQQALARKLDQDPETLAALEAARREVLSRTYLERAAQVAAMPDAAAVRRYYEENPVLFQQRRVYTFNEIVLPSLPANWAALEPGLRKAQTLDAATTVLKAGGVEAPLSVNVVRASEELPLDVVPGFARLKSGDVVIYGAAGALVVAEIKAVRVAPMTLADATPLIERFLQHRDRGEAVQNELKRLRAAAQIAYLGEFGAKGAPGAATSPTAPVPAAAPESAGSVIDKGLKGLQ